jgi:hypothetical protein
MIPPRFSAVLCCWRSAAQRRKWKYKLCHTQLSLAKKWHVAMLILQIRSGDTHTQSKIIPRSIKEKYVSLYTSGIPY